MVFSIAILVGLCTPYYALNGADVIFGQRRHGFIEIGGFDSFYRQFELHVLSEPPQAA
jgi:hypothetical protein